MSVLQGVVFITFDINTKETEFIRNDIITDYDTNTTNIYVQSKYKKSDGETVYLSPSEIANYNFSLYTMKPLTNNVSEITGEVTNELIEQVRGGVIKFVIPKACTNRSGIVKCELHINKEKEKIASTRFILDVQQSLVTKFNDSLLDDEDFPVLQQLILKIQKDTNIDDNNRSKITSYSSDKVENIKEDLSSQIKEKANNENANKRIVCFGDSITHIYAYPRIIGDILGCTTYNVGFAGRCFAGDNPLSMCNVVDAIISKNFTTQETEVSNETEYNFPKQLNTLKDIDFNNVDIVTIAYGTNDCGFNIKIGNITDESKETFAGAINYTIKRLQTAFPHLEIILVTPIFRSMSWTSTDYDVLCDVKANDNQDYLIDFVNMMCEIGGIRNIKVIDNFHNTGINKYNIDYYLSDGVHPKVDTGVPAIAKSIACGIKSTSINTTIASRDLIENEIIYNSIMKIDNPFSAKHFNRNKVAKVNDMSYLTNYRNDIKYAGLIVGIAKGMCYPLNSKIKIRGKICGSYTGQAKIDVVYFYETPLWGNLYKDGSSKGNGVVINIDETEKAFDVIVNTPSSVDKEVLYTCVKILNMEVGNVYVKDITIDEIDLNSYYDSSKKTISPSNFLNGTTYKSGEEFGYHKDNVMLKLTGVLDLSNVSQNTFPLALLNIPQSFPQQIRFIASCMYSTGKDGYVTIIISKDGQMSLRDTGGHQVLYIYLYGINIYVK